VLETVDFGAEGPFKHVPVSARISTIITTIWLAPSSWALSFV
jgi:hypothetical protein